MGALNVNELDFNEIKQNLITFLSSQTEFQDYDFAGSGMSVIMDMLAYTTHYCGVYSNLTINEMFLNTGLLRASVVSKAIDMGYVPSQSTSAVATITISTPSLSNVEIPTGTTFQGSNAKGEGYKFTTVSTYTMVTDGVDASATIPIYEGTLVTEEWTYVEGSGERFILQNENTDVKHMHVNIRENSSTTDYVEWLSFNNIVNISGSTEAYFYRETPEEQIQVYFGNGIIGKALINDNIVSVVSLVSNGAAANGIENIVLIAGFSGINLQDFTMTVDQKSTEGTDKESIAQIKHNAPLYYQSQNRTVTENDYTSILLKEFDYIQAINVWGGEENNPPFYGRVMIAIKPVTGSSLSDIAKENILTHLNGVKVTGIIPVLVDPAYSYIDVIAYVKYNAHLTTKTDSDIRSIITTAIDDHFTRNLYAFNATLKYSELVTDIDDSDESVFSNYVELTLRNDMNVGASQINAEYTYTISFNNPVKPLTYSMTWVTSSAQVMEIKDDGEGNLYKYEDGELKTGTVGTINYESGTFVLIDFNPVLASPTIIPIYAEPDTYDIETIQNNILLEGAVTVDVEQVKI